MNDLKSAALDGLVRTTLPPQLYLGAFDPAKFLPVENFEGAAPHNKPKRGGLWTSTLRGSESEWSRFVRVENLYDGRFVKETKDVSVGTILEIDDRAKILEINTRPELLLITEHYLKAYKDLSGEILKHLDYEALAGDFDALHVSKQGLESNKDYMIQPNISVYDTECTLWFTIEHLQVIKTIEFEG